MKTAAALSVSLCLLVYKGSAQTSGVNVPMIKAHDVFLMPTWQAYSNSNTTLQEFQVFAPGSTLLQQDYTGFQSSSYYSNGYGDGMELMLGLHVRDKAGTGYNENVQFRVGIGYSYVSNIWEGFYKDDRFPFDTLVSNRTGNEIYIDSVLNRNLSLEQNSEYLRLHLSVLYRTDNSKRWSLYGGVGAYGGIGFNSTSSVRYSEYGYTEGDEAYYQDFYGYPNYNQIENTVEEYKTESGYSVSVYAPLGVDFRIAKSNDFFKRVHLFYEMRPGVDFTHVPNYGGINRVYMQFGFGIRVS